MSGAAALIAIVDDEESVRKALSRLLEPRASAWKPIPRAPNFCAPWRYGCRSAWCSICACRTSAASSVQRALKQANAQVPVVIITGDDSPESRADALRQGAKAYLRKPVDDATLIDAIQSAIRSSQVQRPGCHGQSAARSR